MLKIYNLENKKEYLEEVATLEHNEWGEKIEDSEELEIKITKKINKINEQFKDKYFCKLILLDNDKLIGFISIFPTDGDERKDLFPWYSTMYVKEDYRGKGYSRILNDAIIEEAKNRKIKRLFLKTKLNNYYEKFGAKFLEFLSKDEKLYYIDIAGDKNEK